MKKSVLYTIISFAVVLAVYCMVFLVIPFPKATVSWIEFGFTVLAICLSGVVFAYAFRGGVKSKLYGFPIFKVALIYAVAQLVVGIALCVVVAFVNVPVWISVIVSVLLLAVGALGFIATDVAKDVVEELDASTVTDTQTIARLRTDIASIVDICTDATARKNIETLEELLRYSDPVSCPETMNAENELVAKTEQLRDRVKENNFAEAITLTDEIKIKLAERNRLCKLYKK